MFRKTRSSSQGGGPGSALKPGLPEERKALVERYMIDADEAGLRAGRATQEQAREQQARREAEEQARRAAEERASREAAAQAQREAAEAQARRDAAAEQARREAAERAATLAAAETEPHRHGTALESRSPTPTQPASEEFPIYEWLQRAVPVPTATEDWPRSLVKMKEEARRGELPAG